MTQTVQAEPTTPPSARRIIDGTARVILGVALTAAAALLILGQQTFRYAEAATMSALLNPFVPGGVFAFGDHFVIRQDALHYLGLQITVECTTLVLLVPLLLFAAGVIMFLRRVTWVRFIAATLVGLLLIAVVNLARIGMIAVATVLWKSTGYEWTHILIGTVFALIGIVATFVVMLRIMVGRRDSRRRGHPTQTSDA